MEQFNFEAPRSKQREIRSLNTFMSYGGIDMKTLKKEAINAISKLPESANVDDIMYRIYVIDKIKKGQKAVKEGKVITVESLKEEMKSW